MLDFQESFPGLCVRYDTRAEATGFNTPTVHDASIRDGLANLLVAVAFRYELFCEKTKFTPGIVHVCASAKHSQGFTKTNGEEGALRVTTGAWQIHVFVKRLPEDTETNIVSSILVSKGNLDVQIVGARAGFCGELRLNTRMP